MIYYDGELVDYTNKKCDTPEAVLVREQMAELHNKFFEKNAPGYAIIRFPKGARKKDEVTGNWYHPKPFPVFHKSADRMWVYARSKKTVIKDKETYGDAFTVIRDPHMIQKKDIEFLWFLVYHSSDVKHKLLIVENLEEKAKKEANDIASDVDIRFMIYGKSSPIASNDALFREIGTIFDIKEAKRMGINQLKNAIYSAVSEGEKTKNRFINFEVFERLTNGKKSLRTSLIVREAINDGSVKFNTKDYKWYLASGQEFVEPILSVKLENLSHKEELLIEAALSDGSVKGAIFSALGRADYESCEELREFSKQQLMGMASRYECDVQNTDTGEKLVEKICSKIGLEYKPKPK